MNRSIIALAFCLTTAAAAEGDLKWSFTADGPIRSSPAFTTNGSVVFASMNGTIYALDPDRGGQQWARPLGQPILSSPCVDDRNRLFIGNTNGLVALNGSSGAVLWEFKTSSVLSTPTLLPPDTVLFVTAQGRLCAVDSTTGNARWAIDLFDPMNFYNNSYGSPVVNLAGTISVPVIGGAYGPAGALWTVSPGGTLLWRNRLDNFLTATPTVGEDGTLFIAGHNKMVYSLDPLTGATNWSRLIGDTTSCSAALGPSGTLYLGANDGRLYALDSATGQQKWSFLTSDSIHSSPAVAADDTVYFGSYDRSIYALDGRTGAKKWAFKTDGLVLASPVIGEDGTVFIGSYDGTFRAFAGSAPLARSSWPMFKGNVRHTGAVSDSLPVKLTIQNVSSDGAALQLYGRPGQRHILESRSALQAGAWEPLQTYTLTNRIENILDATSSPARYYRLRLD